MSNIAATEVALKSKAKGKSVLDDAKQVEKAAKLIRMGARVQLLQCETSLSYERLIKLYKEIVGKSPSKGQLPFSTDYFLTWQENIHASLFANIHEYLSKGSDMDEVDQLTIAYRLYTEQIKDAGSEPILSITRAWRLVKFLEAKMLDSNTCTKCKGKFVTDLYINKRYYVCGLCNPPARAGKGKATGSFLLN